MEDFILREINKIGIVIQAILQKARLMKRSETATVYGMAKSELLEKIGMDIDAVLESEEAQFAEALVEKYGFHNEDLDKFAELLFDLAAASEDKAQRIKLVSRIRAVYRYLDAHGGLYSFNRHYILEELKKYIS